MILALLFTMLCSACATIPNVDKVIYREQLRRGYPLFTGARGPLSAKESRNILERLKREAGQTDILTRHLALEEAIAQEPLVVGNKVALLENGPATYASMLEAIGQATDSINLESYTIDASEVGRAFAEALIEKQRQGVQVNIIYDAVGSFGTPASFFNALKAEGIMVLAFNPVNPLNLKRDLLINYRDHRKILIVDGKIAFIGGVNISKVYSSNPLRSQAEPSQTAKFGWRDTHIRIEGPVVAKVQELFMESWKSQKGPPLRSRNYFPPLQRAGSEVVRILGRTTTSHLSLIYITLVSAIRNAERSIHLTEAYFAPDQQIIEGLKDASRRGVDVELVLPSITDAWPVLYAGRSHYSDLLEAGVKIYERKNALLHAKTGVIDGVWSTVGSTNLDWRSTIYNSEANAVIIGVDFAGQMEDMFRKDVAESKPITLSEWKRRPLGERIKEAFSRLWQSLL